MALWIIPLIIVLAIIAAYFAANRAMTRRIAAKHGGDPTRAVADEREPIPSAHLITDEERPLGDTPEAHVVLGLPLECVIRSRGREVFFLTWSAGVISLGIAASSIDGGVRSPLVVLLFLPLVFAALSYPLGSMMAVSVVTIAAYLVMA